MDKGKLSELEQAVLKVVEAYAGSARDASPQTMITLYEMLFAKIIENRQKFEK